MGRTVNRIFSVIATAAAASVLTYLFDPERGKRRRAVLRDKAYSKLHDARDTTLRVKDDLYNRGTGMLADVRSRLRHENLPDAVIRERVRSRIGRLVSYPHAIDVNIDNGVIELRGPVLKREVGRLLIAVHAVPGVKDVVNQLELHEAPGTVPGLQGTARTPGGRSPTYEIWPPATRFLVALSGGLLSYHSLRRRPIGASLLTLTGLAMIARAVTNTDLERLLGLRGRHGIKFRQGLSIDAPVEEVFAFWSNFENFPKFMRNVRAVRKQEHDTWHWEVAGPLGTTVEWDARLTQNIPNRKLGWVTLPGAQVEHAGVVRFEPQDGGGTHVDVQMIYSPVAGALGNVVATLFGANPQTEMAEDLQRLKSYFETGQLAREAQPSVGTPPEPPTLKH
jgi:uncharacterized membrane protein